MAIIHTRINLLHIWNQNMMNKIYLFCTFPILKIAYLLRICRKAQHNQTVYCRIEAFVPNLLSNLHMLDFHYKHWVWSDNRKDSLPGLLANTVFHQDCSWWHQNYLFYHNQLIVFECMSASCIRFQRRSLHNILVSTADLKKHVVEIYSNSLEIVIWHEEGQIYSNSLEIVIWHEEGQFT